MATASNTNPVVFNPPGATSSTVPNRFECRKGTAVAFGGTLTITDNNGNSVSELATNSSISFAAGALSVEIPRGGLGARGETDAINGVVDGAITVHLLSGTTELSYTNYQAVTIPDNGWTIA